MDMIKSIEVEVKITYYSIDEIEQMNKEKRIKIAKGIWGL